MGTLPLPLRMPWNLRPAESRFTFVPDLGRAANQLVSQTSCHSDNEPAAEEGSEKGGAVISQAPTQTNGFAHGICKLFAQRANQLFIPEVPKGDFQPLLCAILDYVKPSKTSCNPSYLVQKGKNDFWIVLRIHVKYN